MMIGGKNRLGGPLSLLVGASLADRADVSAILFGNRRHLRLAVDFSRRGLQNARPHASGHFEHVDRSDQRRLERHHRIVHVVGRRRRAGQIVNLVHLLEIRKRDVVTHESEQRIGHQMLHIALVARVIVVQRDHLVPVGEQALAQVTADEAGPAGNQYSFSHVACVLIRPFYARTVPKHPPKTDNDGGRLAGDGRRKKLRHGLKPCGFSIPSARTSPCKRRTRTDSTRPERARTLPARLP